MDILIKNTRIVDSSQNLFGDVYIKNGIIEAIGKNLDYDCEVVDGNGMVLMPSFYDMHVHFREPGLEYKEDIESGSKSAVRGGFTGVNLMGNTKPICSNMEIVDYVLKRGREVGLVDIHQSISITKDFSDTDITHLDDIDEEKVKIITNDGKGVLNNKVMLDVMLKAKEKDLVVMAHAEDEEITPFSYRLSENIETIRDIELAKYTGAKLHLAHVSTKEAVAYVAQAKIQDNLNNITCEVAPHHFTFTSDEVNYRVNPPIREKEDKAFILWAIENDIIDMIATDHAPHTKEDKEKGAPGMVGLETAFSVSYTELVKTGRITLSKLSKLLSENPCKLVGLNRGEIKIGFEGDLVLIDLDEKIVVNSEEFKSKGRNTPFEGKKYYGEILKTFKKGQLVYSKEEK